jgi:hypothetical protein
VGGSLYYSFFTRPMYIVDVNNSEIKVKGIGCK